MTKEQLSCEKTVLQKNLLHYEGLHGRPVRYTHPEFCPGLNLFCVVVLKHLLKRSPPFSGDQRGAYGGEASV